MARKKKQEQEIDTTQESGEIIDPEEEQEQKKKRRRRKFKLFMYLTLLLLIAFTVTAYLFNWFSFRQRVLDVLIVGDDQYMLKMVDLENEKEKAKGEQALAQDAKTAYENQLASLDSREQAIAAKEKQIEDRLSAIIYTTENSDEARSNVISLFESMDAESAASMMESMNDVDTVASILSSMKQKPAAAIMEAFSTEYAALVAARMLL